MTATVLSLFEKIRRLVPSRREFLIGLALFAGLLLIVRASKSPGSHGNSPGSVPTYAPRQNELPPDDNLKDYQRLQQEPSRMPVSSPSSSVAGVEHVASVDSTYGTPLISHGAELALTTKEFSRSRTTLEEILDRHHGYAARLRMVGQPAGSLLTATLRVPSSEFDSAVIDLKTLGKVEREEQTADEVTQQRVDVEARLANEQSRLRRLRELLAKLDKWDSPQELQRQISAVMAEITRLEAERSAVEHRVTFANVLFSMREETSIPIEGFAAQLRRSASAGMSEALGSLSAILLFVIGSGPVTLIWGALVFLPLRWIWKKWRPAAQPVSDQSVQSA